MRSVLSLDIGEVRTGVAIAEFPVFIAHSLPTVNSCDLEIKLKDILKERDIDTVVVGLPRNQSGETTKQTEFVKKIIHELNIPDSINIYWQDESMTSKKAEAELEANGKRYSKGDVDALSAVYILEDYLNKVTR